MFRLGLLIPVSVLRDDLIVNEYLLFRYLFGFDNNVVKSRLLLREFYIFDLNLKKSF